VRIYTARPGIIIGRKGAEIDKLKQEVQKRTSAKCTSTSGSAPSGAGCACWRSHCAELESAWLSPRDGQGGGFRRCASAAGHQGARGSRLNGAEIARKEWYLQGRLPLQAARGHHFGTRAEANTTYGVIGVSAGSTRRKRAQEGFQDSEGRETAGLA